MAGFDRTESYMETQRASLSQLAQGIEHLAEMSEILKKMSQELLRQGKKTPADKPPQTAGNGKGETRCFHLPMNLLEEERALFQECDVSNVSDLLGFICNAMFGTVLLMKNLDHEAELPGFALQLLGESLQKHLDLLERVRSYCGDMDLVQVSVD